MDIKQQSGDYGATTGNDIPTSTKSNASESRCGHCMSRIYPTGFCKEWIKLVKVSTPMMLTNLTQFTFALVAVIFCGQKLGKLELDAVALANSLINVVGLSISVGLSSACDTLFSQIYGSVNKKLIGVILQRSIYIMLLSALPCMAIHINAERFLILVGQDPIISKYAGDYLLIFLPALPSFAFYVIASKYLQNQNILYPTMIIGGVSNGINIILHYILMFELDMGLTGSAISQSVSYILMSILNILYIRISGVYKETWGGFTWESLQEWGQFTKLALFGLVMCCVEWWSFELGMFMTGIKGDVELGAQAIVFQCETVFYMFPFGVSIATSIMIGQYLGAGKPQAAKTVSRVGFTFAAMIGALFAVIFLSFKDIIPKIFSKEEDVIKAASTVLPVLAVYAIFDACVSVSGGILRGAAQQFFGAFTVTIAYMIALSVGIPLLFLTKLSVAGFWLGLAVALFLSAIVYIVYLYKMDWDDLAKQAMTRAKVRIEEEDNTAESDYYNYGDESRGLLGGETRMSRSPSISIPIVRRSLSVAPDQDALNVHQDMKTKEHYLTPTQLLIRRGGTVLFFASTLVVGIICRLAFPPVPLRNLLIQTPAMSTHNVTMPNLI